MSDSRRVGSVIASKYRLDEELGRGGMGAVYRAWHLRVHKEFALKILLSDVAEHRSIASRFFLEAQAAGRIGHPGILDVYDVGEDADGTPFIVMELLRGEPLSALIARVRERIDIDAACWIAMQVLDVLDAAHRAGIVHRDVKPQNVFLTERAAEPPPGSGKAGARAGDDAAASDVVVHGVKLLDFGVAKFATGEGSSLTRSGEIIGSPLYMAPEQAKGEPDVDARADVWSVGAMLFEMLTGKCAHAATSPVAVLAKILTEPAPAPSSRDGRIPPSLDEVVERALRIDRTERWATAREMFDALAAFRNERGTADTTPRLPRAPKRPATTPATDRTPGAISSTIAAPGTVTSTVAARSDAPPRPWSSRPPARAGEENDGAASSAIGGDDGMPARSRRIAAVAAAVGAVVLVGAYLASTHGSEPGGAASSGAMTASGMASTAGSAGAAEAGDKSGTPLEPSTIGPLSTSTLASATGSSSAAPPSSATPSAAAIEPARSGSTPARWVPTTSKVPTPTAPACAANEVLSRGHCCPRGLEWQDGRCERPLATTF